MKTTKKRKGLISNKLPALQDDDRSDKTIIKKKAKQRKGRIKNKLPVLQDDYSNHKADLAIVVIGLAPARAQMSFRPVWQEQRSL